MMPERPATMLLVVSAPSGCGKTTMLRQVMAKLGGLAFSVSTTTRTPRPGEQEGRDYHFVDTPEFLAIRDQEPGGFLEWAEVHGNLYGTRRRHVEAQLAAGLDVILDIDVQGAAQIRAQTAAVSIFIAPPSMAALEQRLRQRGTETEATIRLRLANAVEEMAAADQYDYLIVNDRLPEAVGVLSSIVIAERSRRRRGPDGAPLHWG